MTNICSGGGGNSNQSFFVVVLTIQKSRINSLLTTSVHELIVNLVFTYPVLFLIPLPPWI